MGKHRTKGWKNGRHYSSETEFKKGMTPWNKDLTKETDERVRKNSEATHKKLKEKNYYKGKPHLRMRGKMTREKNPMWKGRKLIHCIYCGKPFEVAPWQERRNRRFCSGSCSGRWLGEQEDFREKQRNAKLGEKHPFYGKHRRPEVIKKIKQSNLETYSKPKTWKNWLEGTRRRPTSCEESLIEILKENDIPFRYVGNGTLNIGNMCPDFVHNNGKEKVIEVYGDYWHKGEDPQERIDAFKKLGYDCLVIWEHELENEGDIINRLGLFLNA